jgi:hypothetical protein
LSDTNVNPSANPNGEQTFKFRDAVGAEVSFKDFDQFRLFDEETKLLIATAQVPESVTKKLPIGPTGLKSGTSSSGQRVMLTVIALMMLSLL